MQKICASCCVAKPLGAFAVRAASSDGRASSCKACINLRNRAKYAIDPSIRALAVARAGAVKARRSQAEPGYRRALVLWQSTKRRGTKIPPWVQIKDFVPLCRKAERLGSESHVLQPAGGGPPENSPEQQVERGHDNRQHEDDVPRDRDLPRTLQVGDAGEQGRGDDPPRDNFAALDLLLHTSSPAFTRPSCLRGDHQDAPPG